MKRVFSCILALILMLTSLSSTAILAIAAGTPTISFNTVETEAGGEPVSLQLSINNNPGIAGLAVSLKYDTNALTLTETKKGTLFSGFTAAKNFAWDESEDVTANGVLATFTFAVLETAAPGEYDVEVIVRSCTNENLDDVDCDVQNGKITVKVKPVAATGVTLNKESLSLKTGESETLVATVSPDNATNKALSWKSDDNTIATVDNNGKVTAVKKGTTTITVTTENGGFTDTCEVSVACSHSNQTPFTEKDSDCKNQGWDAYAKCDDCGQLLAENGTTEIDEIPFRPISQQHTGGTATCTVQAVCTVCGNSYGAFASHSYTATEKKTEALKTEGNCRDNAVYYYSCSVCGLVENNDNHTFLGDKVATTHVGGTALVNQAEADHKTQTDGYTGDNKCLGCNKIIAYGQPIPADAHTPANVWSNDSEHHWKACTVVGCGIVIDGSKAPHSSNKTENKATCQKQAVCDVCGVSYGELASHNYTAENKNQDALKTEGNCRDYAVYYYSCSVCGLVESNNNHTFLGDKVAASHVGGTTLVGKTDANHKTQTDGYTGDTKCLGCNEIISYGQAIPAGAHTPASNWSTDGTHHWKVCTVENCGIVIDSTKAKHTSTGANVATCKTQAKCDICDTAYGSLNVNNHVGRTTLVNQAEANHKTQTNGYTGDTKCLGCSEIIDYGQPIEPEPHAPASVWSSDETHHWKVCNVADCGFVFNSSKTPHSSTGANVATCQKQAVCDVCGVSYGKLASHNYTAENKNQDALKTEGNCRDYAVYYYSCSVCGLVESNNNHTFLGDKVTTTHVGGTTLVGKTDANHKTQTDGYTGDTKCLGCNEIISYGQAIPAGAHTPASNWSTDGTHHWKVCTVENCGIVIDSTKAKHTSTGDNVATCQKRAVCDVCGVSYGTVADHDLANTLSKDETGHWYACQTEGCTEKHQFTQHTLGQTDRTCTACGYRDYVLGDINNDDDVTLTDVVALAQYVAEWDVVCNEKALDVNGDGDVTLTDVVHLAQYVAQWDGIVLH